MSDFPTHGTDDPTQDPEVFCSICFAGIESPEHFRRCVVPAREAEEG